jgi:hypothetical protein
VAAVEKKIAGLREQIDPHRDLWTSLAPDPKLALA